MPPGVARGCRTTTRYLAGTNDRQGMQTNVPSLLAVRLPALLSLALLSL